MRIAIFDPWCSSEFYGYCAGLCDGLDRNNCDVTLFSDASYKCDNKNIKTYPIFFPLSAKMRKSVLRRYVRGIEYFVGWLLTYFRIRRSALKTIHVQWLLKYNIDVRFIKLLKKHDCHIVYTAHNVVPHLEMQKDLNSLKEIYRLADVILLHGKNIKEEFADSFPEYSYKTRIQYHGMYYVNNSSTTNENISALADTELNSRVNREEGLTFLFCGNIFFDKGVDRLIKIWLSSCARSKDTLIVAGEKAQPYPELDELEENIKKDDSIVYINHRISNAQFDYFMEKTDIVVLPYRHASMSGVVFSSAQHSKTVLCTDVGAISEYLEPDIDSFVIKDNDELMARAIEEISDVISRKQLSDMGRRLHDNIEKKFGWDNIAGELIKDIYSTL